MATIPINSGTGPGVAVDSVGTDNYQIVKVMQAAAGATAGLGGPWSVTGTVSVGVTSLTATTGTFTIASITTGTVSVINVLSASGVTVANITTGTVSVVGTVAVSGGGGGVQYSIGDTSMAATGTGTLILGMQTGATTGRGIAVTTTGAQFVAFAGTQAVTAAGVTIASITTGTVSVVNVLSASGVTIASVATGTVNVVNTPTVTVSNVQSYVTAATDMGATATGFVILGMQTGATTGRALAVTASGQALAQIATGTVNVVNVLSASGVTVASVTTGTVNVVNVLSASGVTIASVTTGTVNVVNTVAISGTVSAALLATTASVAVIGTAHASRYQAFVLATTSAAAGVIVKTSGAHTLYLTDVLVSVSGPMSVGLYSETTGPLAQAYLATFGGWVANFMQPIACSSAQSLRVICGSSGSCSVAVQGYTVT